MGFGAGLGLVIKLKAQLSKPIALKDVKEIQDKDNKKANKDPLDKLEDDPYKENCGDVNAWCETAVKKPLEILFLLPSCTSPRPRKEHKIHAVEILTSPKTSILLHHRNVHLKKNMQKVPTFTP